MEMNMDCKQSFHMISHFYFFDENLLEGHQRAARYLKNKDFFQPALKLMMNKRFINLEQTETEC